MNQAILVLALCVAFCSTAWAQGRPQGCPNLWCGCWLSIEIFGRNDPSLWLVSNWLKFPRTEPAPGAVAVIRRGGQPGHVGVVVGFDGKNPIIKSGNHNRRVGTGTYPAQTIIAYVNPR